MLESEQTSISKKMAQLNDYVAWFESEDFALEEALEKFTEARKLADSIQQELDGLKNKITIVKKQFDKE